MAKLMRTAFLIGLAVTWRPDAAAGQYSWSTFSVSAGLGTGGFGVGASYAAVDPWYDSYYADPCWDYAYYELYWYECPVGLHRYPSRQSHYRPVRLLRLPQPLPQPLPFLYWLEREFRIWISDRVLRIPARVLWIQSLQALLSHLRVPGIRLSCIRLSDIQLSGIRRGAVSGEQKSGGSPCARLLGLTARALLPAIQGISSGGRPTYRDGPLDNVRNDGRRTVRLRSEGQGVQRAKEHEGADPRESETHHPRRRADQVTERRGQFRPGEFRQPDADERSAGEPVTNSWAEFQGHRSTRHTGSTYGRGSAGGSLDP